MRRLALHALALACDACSVVEYYAGRTGRVLYELGTALDRGRR